MDPVSPVADQAGDGGAEWKQAAAQLRIENPELTAREVAEHVGVEFQRLKHWLAREKKKNAGKTAGAGLGTADAEPGEAGEVGKKAVASPKVCKEKAYKRVRLPGKGWGMVATRDIKYGELLLEEEPVITLRNHGAVARSGLMAKLGGHEKTGDLAELRAAFAELTAQQQAAVMELHDATADRDGGVGDSSQKTLVGIYRTNCLARGVDNEKESVLCLEVSRFNHSCAQNVGHAFAEPCERIYACRDIAAGEELCTCYAHPMESAAARKHHLQAMYGFECRCAACVLPPAELQAADRRRAKYMDLDEKIASVGGMDQRRGLELIGDALALLEREGLMLPALLARHAYDAYQLACVMRNLMLAKKWATKAYEARLIENGPNHETTKMNERYMKNPKAHPNWR